MVVHISFLRKRRGSSLWRASSVLVKQSELHVKVKEESHHSSISTYFDRLLCSHRACPSYTLYEISYLIFKVLVYFLGRIKKIIKIRSHLYNFSCFKAVTCKNCFSAFLTAFGSVFTIELIHWHCPPLSVIYFCLHLYYKTVVCQKRTCVVLIKNLLYF